jgi:hypothetical protein
MEDRILSDHLPQKSFAEVLIEGEWLEYYLCSKNKRSDSLLAESVYLGKSQEIRINGIVQEPWKTAFHFWKSRSDN